METNYGDLPKDIMIEILSRLTVKSLMRFKYLCRSWNILIKNPSFILKHFKNQNDNNTRLIIYSMDAVLDRPRLSLVTDETLTDLSYQDLDPQVPFLRQIMGPYDGIFCLHENNQIILWNPATRESKALPKCRKPILSSPGDPAAYYCNVGFGLDLVNNSYKLVLIRTIWDDERCISYEFPHVSLYTLTTDSWRHFKVTKLTHYFLYKRNDSTYLNGICYWLAFQDNNYKAILSFHMGDEVFQEIQRPCIPESSLGNLGLYNDFLSLLIFDKIESCLDILVMKDMHWTKQLTIGPLFGISEPLGFWKKGAIFIESLRSQLLLHDPNTQEMRDLGLSTIENKVRSYKESLITFKQENVLFEFIDIPWEVLGVYKRDSL